MTFGSLDEPRADVVILLQADAGLMDSWFDHVPRLLETCRYQQCVGQGRATRFRSSRPSSSSAWACTTRGSSPSVVHQEQDYFQRAVFLDPNGTCINDGYLHRRLWNEQGWAEKYIVKPTQPGYLRMGDEGNEWRQAAQQTAFTMVQLYLSKWCAHLPGCTATEASTGLQITRCSTTT